MARYWVYLHGKVAGPFIIEELLKVSGFHPGSLVCAEAPGGGRGIWNIASNIPELTAAQPSAAPAAPAPLSPQDISDVGRLLEKTALLEAQIAKLMAGPAPAAGRPPEMERMLAEKARVDGIMAKVEAIASPAPPEPLAAAARTYTILNIDDDPNIRRLLKLRLELKGMRVVSFDNAPDALAYLGESSSLKPDLIICDVMMPGMDGYEVCRQIRARNITVPFLFLTSKGSSVEKVRGIEAGADDYLLKPFDPHELEAKVARHLGASIPRKENSK